MAERSRQRGEVSAAGDGARGAAAGSGPGPEPSDAKLLAAIADGSEDALTELYERYSAVVLAVALRILHDRQEAEDVLVDVFQELWTRAQRYDPSRGGVLNYLNLLARSRALDRRRRLVRGQMPGGEAAETTRDEHPGPAEAAHLAERRAQVRQAITRLKPEHQAALELFYFHGLTQAQVAARLEEPLGTVKTRIRNGLIQLREILRNLG